MYAITGITGQVGGAVARKLLSNNQSVCAVIRDAKKGTAWVEQGCAVALADMNDADALTAAFRNAEGVFVVIPPNFAPSPGFLETRAIVAALRTAITSGRLRQRSSASGQSRLPVHHWRTGNPVEPTNSTSDIGASIGGSADAARLSSSSLVYGERGLGRSTRQREWHYPKLPTTLG
ncbi:NAD(P)H-binding protein [Nostoc sp.]|uniref:NAD(P)H-binding protein n=1 Tax=Nostoc sp. TaxID=1180 RepID=UPI002FFCDF53